MTRPPLSLLDLTRVREDQGPAQALRNAAAIAAHVETLGFRRYWVAEHHNMEGVASAATPVVIGHVAGATKTIRVGAGGVMLPNHAPYVIAEQFGTLAQLYPGRIDLGLGRAPGTDGATLIRALRRDPQGADRFPQDVVELMGWFAPENGHGITAVPAAGTDVEMVILGSSHFGAMLAAQLGLPYAFASHFAPAALDEALHLYRSNFRPSDRLRDPHVMVAVNVLTAETEAEARHLFTTTQQGFLGLIRNNRRFQHPPGPLDWTPREEAHVMGMLSCHACGTPDQVRAGLEGIVSMTRADELILVTDCFDFEARKRSLSLTAEVWT
ncbi:LLM class flavin-dependent oxidoreductase [Gemmobacter serpentinus]|uniref:LLM class flavin-dependent oxidoreductase n=1 Tax=Gemmobacter serpentinus TaxID=2652247 RepID=UPI00124C55E8|nr:LLM class flavin-dependent oxidoreductase [Gemmobacter serpentinus]